ncbi:MAG: MBL fold metallo-hydrolase [Betaproteobacteria bacterium]
MTAFRKLSRALLALLALLSGAAHSQNVDKIEVRTEKLSATTYMLTGMGGNIGVSIGNDAVFVIDDQYAPMTPKITAAIKALTDKPVQFVLNTHWHGDHTGGNENFRQAGALIIAHDNVRKRLSSEQFLAHINRKIPPSPEAALPVVTFSSDLTFHINGDEVHVFHVPNAHTDGDAIIHFRKGNIVHVGDIMWHNIYPIIDAKAGGTPEGMIAAVDRVLALSDEQTRIIPGHGPLAGKADLKAYRDMLATIAGRVKALVKAGRSLDEVIAAKPTAEFDERWGKGFFSATRFTEMMFSAYSAPAPAAK